MTANSLTKQDARKFAEGIVCGDISFLPAEMKITGENKALVEICEGKFHQVKKMFSSVGAEVISLKRLRIGEIFLDESLKQGEFRELTESEIKGILSRKHGI